MMKLSVVTGLSLLVCAALIQPSESGMTIEQLKQSGKMARKGCQPKVGATTEQLDRLQLGKFDEPADQKVKCYTKCVHTMMQVMKKGKFDTDKCIAQMMKVLPAEYKKVAKETMEKCRTAGDGLTDPCDISYAQVLCGYKHEPEHFFFP